MSELVLHICETARGGVGVYINTITSNPRRLDNDFILAPDRHANMFSSSSNLRTFRHSGRGIVTLIRMITAAVFICRQIQPHVVFCHSTLSLATLIFLRILFRKKKFIYCAHGWAGACVSNRWYLLLGVRMFERITTVFAHKVVNVSKSDFHHAMVYKYFGHHILIENAVLPRRHQTMFHVKGFEESTLNILFAGRHDFQKGLDILIQAFNVAMLDRPDLRLFVIGESVVDDEHSLHPSKGITYFGWIDNSNLDSYYSSADVLVLPSRWEGLPLVLLEALRNGLPALVSDRSFLPDLIEPEKTGFVTALSVSDLATAISSLKKEKLTSMKDDCLFLFENRFHVRRLWVELDNLYEEVTTR